MRAIDTNVVVRFLIEDHPDQTRRSKAVMLKGDLYLSLTVCLETEWVMRSAYQITAAVIADKLEEIAGFPGIAVENPEMLAFAIVGFRSGMDFADALHLATASHCTEMLSFDEDFAEKARRLETIPVIAP